MEVKVLKLKGAFETAVIERYRRRESSVEEALIEMYLAGVSVRRVEDITEALWETKVLLGTIAASIKMLMNISKPGGLTLFLGTIHMFMWMVFI